VAGQVARFDIRYGYLMPAAVSAALELAARHLIQQRLGREG
jgi:hypothetical protein